MPRTVGLITGKFYPPHLGHSYLIRSAREQAGDLIVIVFSRSYELIPGSLRAQWLGELFPEVEVLHVLKDYPDPTGLNDLEAWDFWTTAIREACPRPPDVIFTSEDYGDELARRLHARHVAIDKARAHFPVSGSQIRADPMANLKFLEPNVRRYFSGSIGDS